MNSRSPSINFAQQKHMTGLSRGNLTVRIEQV